MIIHVRRFGSGASTHQEVSAAPAFAVPLPAFSPPEFAPSVAVSAAEPQVSPRPVEACAAADVRLAEESADVERADCFPDELLPDEPLPG